MVTFAVMVAAPPHLFYFYCCDNDQGGGGVNDGGDDLNGIFNYLPVFLFSPHLLSIAHLFRLLRR